MTVAQAVGATTTTVTRSNATLIEPSQGAAHFLSRKEGGAMPNNRFDEHTNVVIALATRIVSPRARADHRCRQRSATPARPISKETGDRVGRVCSVLDRAGRVRAIRCAVSSGTRRRRRPACPGSSVRHGSDRRCPRVLPESPRPRRPVSVSSVAVDPGRGDRNRLARGMHALSVRDGIASYGRSRTRRRCR